MHVPVSVQGCNFPKVIWKEKEKSSQGLRGGLISCALVITKCLVICVCGLIAFLSLCLLRKLHRLLVPRVARSIALLNCVVTLCSLTLSVLNV